MLRCSLGVSLRRASALPAPSSTTMTSILSGPLYVSETYVLILLSQRSSVTRKTCSGFRLASGPEIKAGIWAEAEARPAREVWRAGGGVRRRAG